MPDAVGVIRTVREELGDRVVLGAGTVLDAETARAALLAGAEYDRNWPTVNADVRIRPLPAVRQGRHARGVHAHRGPGRVEAGGDVVKVFPAEVGGPPYLQSALRGPLPQVRLMPTGGVDLTTAEAFLKAGACCLGVGGSLVDPKAVASGDFGRLRDLASQFAAIVRRHRGE